MPDRAQAGTRRETCPAVEANTEADGRPMVLVVDDDASARDLLAAMLAQGRIARRGGAAVARRPWRWRASCGPSAITLDVIMPHVDGWSVLTALKADPELATIPVIVVTVCADRDVALALGATEFMTKPVDTAG